VTGGIVKLVVVSTKIGISYIYVINVSLQVSQVVIPGC